MWKQILAWGTDFVATVRKHEISMQDDQTRANNLFLKPTQMLFWIISILLATEDLTYYPHFHNYFL